jgi:hypothetical protein
MVHFLLAFQNLPEKTHHEINLFLYKTTILEEKWEKKEKKVVG